MRRERHRETHRTVRATRVTGHQRAGRKKTLRHAYGLMSLAVVAAGKLHRGEPLRQEEYIDELESLNRGIEAARLLAKEFARLSEEHALMEPQPPRNQRASRKDRNDGRRAIEAQEGTDHRSLASKFF
jgi:hypothetical protein